MTPFPGLLGITLALASLCIMRGLRDRGEAVLLHHLARNRVDLHFRHHVALPGFHQSTPQRFASSRLPRETAEPKVSFLPLQQIIFGQV
jgi:hypothetical protein